MKNPIQSVYSRYSNKTVYPRSLRSAIKLIRSNSAARHWPRFEPYFKHSVSTGNKFDSPIHPNGWDLYHLHPRHSGRQWIFLIPRSCLWSGCAIFFNRFQWCTTSTYATPATCAYVRAVQAQTVYFWRWEWGQGAERCVELGYERAGRQDALGKGNPPVLFM
jgi:hypothetical protein